MMSKINSFVYPLIIFIFLLIFIFPLPLFALEKDFSERTTKSLISEDAIEALNRERVIDLALDEAMKEHATVQDQTVSDKLKAKDASANNHSLYSKVRFFVGGTNKNRSIYYIDYLLPLYYASDRTTLVFFNPKQNIQNPESYEANFGLGLRKSFDDDYILGLHSFFDRKRSVDHLYFNQIGWGAEFLSEPLDLRFNYYLPLSGIQSTDEVTYELGSTHLIRVNGMEEALRGFDIECGFPFFEKFTKTRLYPGGFFYQSKLTKDLNGFRFRTETSFNSWLSLDTTLNTPTNNKTEFMAGLRVTVPLEFGRSYHKNKDGQNARPDSYIENRMFERVVRDIDIQTAAGKRKEEDPNIEMIYADNTNSSGVEDGSLEHPYSTLADAFGSPRYGENKYIYIFNGDGTSTGYTDTYTLADGVVLWGSGYDGGYPGIATPGYPNISGGALSAIVLGANNTVMGCQLSSSGNVGVIRSSGEIGTTTIKHNMITASLSGSGIGLSSPGAGNKIIIADNAFSSSNPLFPSAISIYDINNSDGVTLDVYGNTISGFTKGVGVTSTTNGNTFYAKFSRNTITGNLYGLSFERAIFADPGIAVIDMGGGALGSEGYNVFDNSLKNFSSVHSETASAQYNWWGQSPPNAGKFSGNIDYTHWLTSAP